MKNLPVLTVQHGDVCATPARRLPGFYHFGIYDAWRDGFIHNTDPGGVQHAIPAAFINGKFFIARRASSPSEAAANVLRAATLLRTEYDLLSFNCEHFVNLVAEGKVESKQLQRVVLGAILTGAFLFALASDSNA